MLDLKSTIDLLSSNNNYNSESGSSGSSSSSSTNNNTNTNISDSYTEHPISHLQLLEVMWLDGDPISS